jgi:uncharacterized protein YecE (DUF72 family)
LWIGTSGWQYRSWKGTFYPERLAQRQWLECYAEHFRTVEVNNAFYRLPEASTFEQWRDRTPADFIVGVKASRYLTHVKRLHDPEEPVARFMQRASRLGPKLGPVLVQLPPSLGRDVKALDEVLRQFPASVKVTVEFRHESWFVDETYALLRDRDVALCLADSPRRRTPVIRTAGWGYIRFHEGRATPHPCYGRTALATWATRLADLWDPADDVYAYFNNDGRACAVRDAAVFARAADKAGLEPSRVPGRGDVRVG